MAASVYPIYLLYRGEFLFSPLELQLHHGPESQVSITEYGILGKLLEISIPNSA
jgi:hypothetical protein